MQLVKGLHPLGHCDEIERGGHRQDARDQGPRPRLVRDPLHELPVELDRAGVEPPQIAQRGVAGTEIVDGDPDPELAQLADDLDRAVPLVEQRLLGDFEDEAVWR